MYVVYNEYTQNYLAWDYDWNRWYQCHILSQAYPFDSIEEAEAEIVSKDQVVYEAEV